MRPHASAVSGLFPGPWKLHEKKEFRSQNPESRSKEKIMEQQNKQSEGLSALPLCRFFFSMPYSFWVQDSGF
jgi:hypothetical protein